MKLYSQHRTSKVDTPTMDNGVPVARDWRTGRRVSDSGRFFAFLVGLGITAIAFAPSAFADDNRFLADLTSPGVVHPALSDSDLLIEGRQMCFEIGKIGLTPDAARDALVKDLDSRGVPTSYAEAGTLVHFALRDLCPDVPNTTGI